MKTVNEIVAALQNRCNEEHIKKLQGFSYVPWNTSNRIANEIFGFLGWSSEVRECVQETLNTGEKEFKGYRSVVRITVTALDEETKRILVTFHDGVGFGEIQFMGNKNPMDTACKAAQSDGISRALKHFGDAFGLFLYDKEDPSNQQTSSAPTSGNNGYKQSNGSTSNEQKKWPVSDGRKPHMIKQFKLTKEQVNDVNFIDNDTAKDMLELLWHKDEEKKKSVAEILAMPKYAHLKPASKSTPVGSDDDF